MTELEGAPTSEGFVPIWVTIARFLVSQCRTCNHVGQVNVWRNPDDSFITGPCPDCKDLRELTAGPVAPTATRPAAMVETRKGEG